MRRLAARIAVGLAVLPTLVAAESPITPEDFEAHVTPNVMGTIARVSELVCLGCLKAYKLDGAARLAGSNTVKEPDFESQAPNDIRARAVRESNEQS